MRYNKKGTEEHRRIRVVPISDLVTGLLREHIEKITSGKMIIVSSHPGTGGGYCGLGKVDGEYTAFLEDGFDRVCIISTGG
jgi:hypothetical protein